MLIKLFTFYIYLQSALCGCSSDKRNSDFERLRKNYKVSIERIGRLDDRIKESSGFAFATDTTYWSNPDSGIAPELYEFNLSGELLKTEKLDLPNTDWEDLAQSKTGELYIGDFGNNANLRRDLRIYKLHAGSLQIQDTIRFQFSDQQGFPPVRKNRHYDLEAFFHHNDSLYLFTKSRALKPLTKLYKLPASGTNHDLQPIEEMRLKSPVTAADIVANGSRFALLGYGRLYLFEQEGGQIGFEGRRYCLPVGRTGQAEAVLFLSPNQLLLSNEKGKLYLVTIEPK